jgi:hypothetical protein
MKSKAHVHVEMDLSLALEIQARSIIEDRSLRSLIEEAVAVLLDGRRKADEADDIELNEELPMALRERRKLLREALGVAPD